MKAFLTVFCNAFILMFTSYDIVMWGYPILFSTSVISGFELSITHFKRFYRNFSFSIWWLFPMFSGRAISVLIFSWINDFILLLNHGGYLSLHTISSWGIKSLSIFKTVSLKVKTFPSTLIFPKVRSQFKWLISILVRLSRESL